jgi:hypothetical protein
VTVFPTGDGVWLKCQFHAHTTNSDGDPTPAGLCDHYLRAGFDVLAITDHWHVTDHVCDGLVVMPSSELSARCDNPWPEAEAEVLALGVAVLPEARHHFPTIEALAAWIRGQGGAPYLCHPYWSGLGPQHYLEAPSLVGLEVYNAGSEVTQGNGLASVHWDDILSRGATPFAIATDDSHHAGQDSRLGWTMVRAAERSGAAVVEALLAGRAYSSSGPQIHDIEVDGDAVEVRCSPARAVFLRSGAWGGGVVSADPFAMPYDGQILARNDDGLITAARFPATSRHWRWGRIEVDDVRGRRAWSNPWRLDAA